MIKDSQLVEMYCPKSPCSCGNEYVVVGFVKCRKCLEELEKGVIR